MKLVKLIAVILLITNIFGCANTDGKKDIYPGKTNGIDNSKLIEIAKEFIKSNPEETYWLAVGKKITKEEYDSSVKEGLNYAINNDPSFVEDFKRELYVGSISDPSPLPKNLVSWRVCSFDMSKIDKDGQCNGSVITVHVLINSSLEAEKIYYSRHLEQSGDPAA